MLKELKIILMISLILFVFLVKFGVGETNFNEILKKIDSDLLRSEGKVSVLITFTKKPKNYRQIIKSVGGKIIKDYNLIEGVAVEIDSKKLIDLAKSENLKKIYKNKKVKALLHESAPLISADNVWDLGITGKGVKVCIVDTGIDYTHPAIESNCKPQVIEGNKETYILESPHDYPNNYNYTWEIKKPGFTNISIHFANISTEYYYDKIYIKDAQENVVETYTGKINDRWTVSVPGDTIKINLVSDYSITDYGFFVDEVLNGSVSYNLSSCKKIVNGYDFVNNDEDPFDDNGHGTHVAGIISSNDPYSRGVANGTKLLIAKVLDHDGYGYESDVIEGIEWCVENSANIISMSLGGTEFPGTCDDVPLSQGVNNAVTNGSIVVVSAGNSGKFGITEPACASKAIAVGAIDKNSNVVGFSSKGPELDVLAPGFLINSSLPGGWSFMSGTSMAAPHVAGVVALMLEVNPEISFQDVLNLFEETSDPVNECFECWWVDGVCEDVFGTVVECNENVTGSGIINASRAIEYISSPYPRYYNVSEPEDPSIYSPFASYDFGINWAGDIDKVILEFNGKNYTDLEKNGNHYVKSFFDLSVGTYYYRWYANDTSNNWNETDLLSFKIEKAPSSVKLFLNGYEGNITVSGYENVNITAELIEGEGTIKLFENGTLIDEGFYLTFLKSYESGVYNITAVYTETENYTSSFKTYFIENLVDKEKPVITILYPKNRTYYSRSIYLKVSINENFSWMGYSLDNGANVTLWKNKPSGSYYKYIYVNYGSHNIVVYANDTSGNMGSSNRVYFKNRRGGGGGGCLIEGSEILTPEGFKRIEDIEIGDTVIGYENGKEVEAKVTNKTSHFGFWDIYYYKGYWFTETHKVYPSLNGGAVVVSLLSDVKKQYTGNVYDIKTETHNYFGKNGFLIHNWFMKTPLLM